MLYEPGPTSGAMKGTPVLCGGTAVEYDIMGVKLSYEFVILMAVIGIILIGGCCISVASETCVGRDFIDVGMTSFGSGIFVAELRRLSSCAWRAFFFSMSALMRE